MKDLFKWAVLIVVCIVGIGVMITLGSIWENNGSGQILVIQAPMTGELKVYTDPGMKWQGWGTVTHYKRSNIFEFPLEKGGMKTQFNDGGHGRLGGSVQFDLPLSIPEILDLHKTYGSQEAIEDRLVENVMGKSVFLSGPLMSSAESYSKRKNDLIGLIEDQAVKGIYQTVQAPEEVDDLQAGPGKKKWDTVVHVRTDKDGVLLRQEPSPIIRFGVKMYNFTIKDMDYDDIVKQQIAAQQKATIDVQIAMANSTKARQDTLTTEEQGKAASAKAKWEQEAIKATEVTEAEKQKAVALLNANQRLEVSELDRQAADKQKQKQILLGEGEAQARKLVMEADGALNIKIAAWKEINAGYAGAIAAFHGNLVPSVVMGSSGSGKTDSVTDFMDLLKAKTARDLSLDMSLPTKTK